MALVVKKRLYPHPTNMAPDRGSLQEEVVLPGTLSTGAMLVGGRGPQNGVPRTRETWKKTAVQLLVTSNFDHPQAGVLKKYGGSDT